MLAAATLCERAAHAAVDTLQEAPLTLADVTPPVVPAQPLSPRQVLMYQCTVVCDEGNGTGAQTLTSGCGVHREQAVVSLFERNTYSVVNIFDVTLVGG